MKKIFSVLCAAMLAGTAAFASPVFAAEESKSTTIVLNTDDIKKALGLSIYLQGSYNYNFNGPESGLNDWRGVLDTRANSFLLDLAQIQFLKDPAKGGAGFKFKLNAGEWAKNIHATGMGNANDPFDLTEAFISYIAPLGNGVRFDFGKMGTFIGAEVLEARDNPNYSRSFLFNYAQPLTHTGLKVGYGITDSLTTALFVVNGWDNATDSNKGKSYGASIGFAPAEQFSTIVNVIFGPEQASNNSNYRSMVDVVATIKPIKPLTIILNYDYGYEKGAVSGVGAHWDGISAIAKVDINDMFSAAIRGEYFNDRDSARTGTQQELKEVTLSGDIKLAGSLILRPEYRHDWSNKTTFAGSTKKQQDTVALGVMYSW